MMPPCLRSLNAAHTLPSVAALNQHRGRPSSMEAGQKIELPAALDAIHEQACLRLLGWAGLLERACNAIPGAWNALSAGLMLRATDYLTGQLASEPTLSVPPCFLPAGH
jgi:hypothetical protein